MQNNYSISLSKFLALTPTMFDHQIIIGLYFDVLTLGNSLLDVWVPSLGTVFLSVFIL